MELVNKKILHIESFPDTPLIDTSTEIALNLKDKNNVNFFWCGYDLPWKDWELSIFKKTLGFSFEKKVSIIENILRSKKVNIIDKIHLSEKKQNYIYKWANNYNKKKNLKKFLYKENNVYVNLGISVESSLLSIYKNYNFKKNDFIIKKSLISSAIVFNRSLEAIKRIKPSSVITFNNRFAISRPIIEAAKLCKVNVIRHEVGSSKKKYELFYDDVHNVNSRCKVIYNYWNNTSKKTRLKNAVNFFKMPYKNKNKINTGSGKIKSFSKNQSKTIQLPKNKKIVTFFTSSNYEYEAISADFSFLARSIDFKDQITALKSLVSIVNKFKNYLLVIRVHPSFKNSDFENSFWEKYESNNIKLIKSESKINSFDLMKKSDYVVTYGSTLAIHAAYNNIPSITLRKHVFSCSKILIEPKNKRDLYKILRKKNFKNTKIKCLPYGNYIMSFGKKFKYFKRDIIFKGYINGIMVNNFGTFVNFVLSLFYPLIRFYKKNEFD
tara:strand:- start:1150 stop:2631 length:1482 start_codon:yes stop_codon:yes gene_type:complete